MGEPGMLLAGDIGGTKTHLAIVSPEHGPRAPLAKATLRSADYPNLEVLAREFMERVSLPVERACFGVAGPVRAGQAKVTNLPWSLDERQLEDALGIPSVRLLNDLEAIASAVPHLELGDIHTLNVGEPDPAGALAVVAPGTGLGEAYLTRVWHGLLATRGTRRAHASEGGHADFAPTNDLEVGLLRHLQDRFGHVSYERVCSGPGLANIYAFLRDSGYAEEPPWLAERLASADDPTPIIVTAALDEEAKCDLCLATLRTFVSILGAEAGNLALKVLATGGVYLGGGIPRRILPALEDGGFMAAFTRKGRMSELTARMPVHVILNPEAALLGAAYLGLEGADD